MLSAAFFFSTHNGRIMGTMNSMFTAIEGTGIFFNNKKEIIISDFINSHPNGTTLTILNKDSRKFKISIYVLGKEIEIIDIIDNIPTYV
jgi:hypothetical protein